LISAPPTDATSNELADWLELEVLSSTDGIATLFTVNENLEIDEDAEPDELDQENLLDEKRLQQVAAAVDERVRVIGSGYPFRIDPAGKSLTLKYPLDAAGCTYLFCLIVSNAAKDGLLAADGPSKPNLVTARGLFHVCATVSAAGFVEGPAFCIGWPRPDSTNFLEKLRTIYRSLNDGEIHAEVPPGAPAQVKDDGIDVIAWKQPIIPPAGAIYFLGQAASGANWRDKGLKGGPVDMFHGTWFSRQPASQVIVGTIMPFVLATEADADDHEEQEAIAERFRRELLRHGHILFRHLVAKYVARAVEIAAQVNGPIERVDELTLLCDYVSAYRRQLQAAVATAQ
jgi:hypothetical protein